MGDKDSEIITIQKKEIVWSRDSMYFKKRSYFYKSTYYTESGYEN